MNQPAQQQQQPPGDTAQLDPRPDHGEQSYRGSERLAGKAAVITGADSGIGRAVAIAYAREGADVLISYLDEHDDARETASWVEQAGGHRRQAHPVISPQHGEGRQPRRQRPNGGTR